MVGGDHWRRALPPPATLLGFAGLTTRLLLPCGFQSQVSAMPLEAREIQSAQDSKQCGQEWESGLPKKKLQCQWRRLALGRWEWGGWLSHRALHFCRSWYWKWNPNGIAKSWASFRVRMWAGENLGCFASLASVHGHVLGWWEQGQLASVPVCKEISRVRPSTETYKVDL